MDNTFRLTQEPPWTKRLKNGNRSPIDAEKENFAEIISMNDILSRVASTGLLSIEDTAPAKRSALTAYPPKRKLSYGEESTSQRSGRSSQFNTQRSHTSDKESHGSDFESKSNEFLESEFPAPSGITEVQERLNRGESISLNLYLADQCLERLLALNQEAVVDDFMNQLKLNQVELSEATSKEFYARTTSYLRNYASRDVAEAFHEKLGEVSRTRLDRIKELIVVFLNSAIVRFLSLGFLRYDNNGVRQAYKEDRIRRVRAILEKDG